MEYEIKSSSNFFIPIISVDRKAVLFFKIFLEIRVPRNGQTYAGHFRYPVVLIYSAGSEKSCRISGNIPLLAGKAQKLLRNS